VNIVRAQKAKAFTYTKKRTFLISMASLLLTFLLGIILSQRNNNKEQKLLGGGSEVGKLGCGKQKKNVKKEEVLRFFLTFFFFYRTLLNFWLWDAKNVIVPHRSIRHSILQERTFVLPFCHHSLNCFPIQAPSYGHMTLQVL